LSRNLPLLKAHTSANAVANRKFRTKGGKVTASDTGTHLLISLFIGCFLDNDEPKSIVTACFI
jgi:hypothetical protein